jgi:hypothetical protein
MSPLIYFIDNCHFLVNKITFLFIRGYYATGRKVAGSNPDEVDFFNLPKPSSRNISLGSAQPLGVKGPQERKADNLTICQPIV